MAGFLQQPDLHTKAEHRAALLTYPGNLREALRQAQEDATKTLFGVAHGIPSVFMTKVIASTKPDFIWIDVEHGIFNRETLYDAIQAAQHHSEGKSLVIVRVPKHDEISMTTALDAGAAGIVLPHCESAAEVQGKIKEMFYPPLGQRSFSPWTFTPGISDASLYPGDPFNVQTSNRHIAVIPQIESVKGVENVEEIAALENVHALMFGPGDFMLDAGIELKLGGEPDPRFLAAMGKFVGAGKKYNKALLGGAQTVEMVPMLIAQGFSVIAVVFDYWGIAQMIATNISKARAYVTEKAAPTAESNGTKAESNGTKDESNGAAVEGKDMKVVANGVTPTT